MPDIALDSRHAGAIAAEGLRRAARAWPGLSRSAGQQPGLSALPADDREADRARTAADAAEGGRREYERVAPRGKRAASQPTAAQDVVYARAGAAREAAAGSR